MGYIASFLVMQKQIRQYGEKFDQIVRFYIAVLYILIFHKLPKTLIPFSDLEQH